MVATAKLNNSVLGWILVPANEISKDAVAHLYGRAEDYDKMSRKDMAIMKGEPIEAVKAHIKATAEEMGVRVSYCGKSSNPTVRIWFNPAEVAEPEDVTVDLKWACWTSDKGIWDEYAPGAWDRVKAAFDGATGPIRVLTGPRKESRHGSVTISKGRASGHFSCVWDEMSELADTLGAEADDEFAEAIPFSSRSMEPGVDREFDIKARKLSKLMERIDAEEESAMRDSDSQWKNIEAMFSLA